MVLLLASSGPQAPVSPDPDEEPCPPERVGVADHQVVQRFVSDLRKALTSGDATAVVGLIRFPLVVNSRDRAFAKVRTRTFQGVGELTRYAAEVFSKGLRERVLNSSASDLICRPGQVGLADGLIWARPDTLGRLHVEVVNNDEFQWPAMASAELLRCETSRRLVVIDRPRAEVRFRAWPRRRNGSKVSTGLLRGTGMLYGAKLLFQWRVVEDGKVRRRRLCEERVILLRARSPRDALAQARRPTVGRTGRSRGEPAPRRKR